MPKAKIINSDLEFVPANQLITHPKNVRQGDVGAIFESIQENGFFGTLVVQRSTNHILAGNHRFRAALEAGIDMFPVIYVDVDDDQALRILLADNRTNDLATNDESALIELLKELNATERGLSGTGYDGDSLDEMISALGSNGGGSDSGGDSESPIDRAAELRKQWGTESGQIWAVGAHRLYVGDCRDVLDSFYAPVTFGCLLTDPPYGIDLDTDYSKFPIGNSNAKINRKSKTYSPVTNDGEQYDPRPVAQVFESCAEQFWFGANYYRRYLSESDRDGSWLVWDKRNDDMDAMFGSGFELIWSRQKHKQDLLRFIYAGAAGVEASNRSHPTQKPTPLLMEIMNRWSPEKCNVADPYLGSGSTMLAAHKCDRVCYGSEIEPDYCAVILERMASVIERSDVRLINS